MDTNNTELKLAVQNTETDIDTINGSVSPRTRNRIPGHQIHDFIQ